MANILQHIVLCGYILRYIAHAILLKCENACDTDIAGLNIARWR